MIGIATVISPENMPSFMQFTAAEWAMIIGAIGLIISNWRNGSKTESVIKRQASTEVKLDQIHEVTNSNMTAVKNDMRALAVKLEAAITANASLQLIIQDLHTQRDKVAEIAARVAEKTPAAAAPPQAEVVKMEVSQMDVKTMTGPEKK